MIDRQISRLNKMLDACSDPGVLYWKDTGETFEAISDFIHSFPDNLAVQYIPHEEFRIYKIDGEE